MDQAGQAGYNYHRTQSLPQQQQQQQQYQQQQQQMQHQSLPQQQQQLDPAMLDNYGRAGQLARPLMSSSPVTDLADPATSTVPDNTRMNMRMQRDAANAAGMKCS